MRQMIVTNYESFIFKTKIIGKTPNNGNTKNAEIFELENYEF